MGAQAKKGCVRQYKGHSRAEKSRYRSHEGRHRVYLLVLACAFVPNELF